MPGRGHLPSRRPRSLPDGSAESHRSRHPGLGHSGDGYPLPGYSEVAVFCLAKPLLSSVRNVRKSSCAAPSLVRSMAISLTVLGARFPMLNAPVLRFMRHARPSLSRVLHTTLSTVSGHYFATPPQTRTCSSQSFRRYRGPRCCMRRLKMLRLEDIDLLGMPSFSTSLQGPA